MGGFLSRFFRDDELTPIKEDSSRVLNIISNNFRGIFGFIVPFVVGCAIIHQTDDVSKIGWVWLTMLWCLLVQPVAPPVVGTFPLFMFPLLGVFSSEKVCPLFFDSFISLMVIGGWCLMMFNNSGLTRRGILAIIGHDKITPISFLLKTSLATFIFSAVSHRLITTSEIMSIITPILINTQSVVGKGKEIDYDKFRYVVCCSIQTSAAIGSLVFIHTSYNVLVTISMYNLANKGSEEIFTYCSYTAFALPTCIVLFLANFIYFVVLLKFTKNLKDMSPIGTQEISKALLDKSKSMGKFTLHEGLTVFFWLLLHALIFSRSSTQFKGWAVKDEKTKFPRVEDACVFAIFAIFLHILPKGFSFLKYITAKKKRQLPPRKPESAILFWKFVDVNTPYAYIFLMGAGPAVLATIMNNEAMLKSAKEWFKFYADTSFLVSALLACLLGTLLSTLITGTGAAVIYLPAILIEKTDYPHLTALAAGMSCTFGFMSPFLHTTGYFTRKVGKVPSRFMIMYNFGSSIVCTVVLWAMLISFGPSALSIAAAPAGSGSGDASGDGGGGDSPAGI